jgi:hypothetical protein
VLQFSSHTSPSKEWHHTIARPGFDSASAARPPGAAMTAAAGNTCAPKSHAPTKMSAADRGSSFVRVRMYALVSVCQTNGKSAIGHAYRSRGARTKAANAPGPSLNACQVRTN